MANFIIPDDVLEKLICNTCFKYLSVKPVTVYFDGTIRCGRCSQNGLGGLVSLFELVADKCLFKCVNRRDGCQKLLRNSQVYEHEKVCKAEWYDCPYCPFMKIPTSLLVRHFEENHRERLLETPDIQVKVDEQGVQKMYLYQMHDHLFYIEVEHTESGFDINTWQLRMKEKQTVKQNFVIISQENTFLADRELDVVNYSEPSRKYSISRQQIGTSETFTVRIILSFDYYFSQLQKSVDVTTNTVANLEENYSLETFLSPTPMYSGRSIRWPRKIKLLDFGTVCLNWNSTAFFLTRRDEMLEIFSNCVNCAELHYYYFVYNVNLSEGRFIWRDGGYKAICYFCYHYYRKICGNKCIPSNMLQYYYCKQQCCWGCDYTSMYLLPHELSTCGFQPRRTCPAKNCNFNGTLTEITKHFEGHPRGESFTHASVFSLALPHEPFEDKMYIWLAPYFATLTLKYKPTNKLTLRMNMRDENDEVRIRPQALLFTSYQRPEIQGNIGFFTQKLEFVGGVVDDIQERTFKIRSRFILLKCYLKYARVD
ncbi:uncharacterized protein [Leptinotarsa decemlineata]|uniref:uncharacterized protein n=1 Tax=Leptinotarsa decemlineata TaxID=7539 RepID=UPI003D30559A